MYIYYLCTLDVEIGARRGRVNVKECFIFAREWNFFILGSVMGNIA